MWIQKVEDPVSRRSLGGRWAVATVTVTVPLFNLSELRGGAVVSVKHHEVEGCCELA